VDAYTAVVAGDRGRRGPPDHRLDYLAAYHPAVTRTAGNRAEMISTLPAESTHHAKHQALALVEATGHRPIRLEVVLAEAYDRETRRNDYDAVRVPCRVTVDP
jgi:hypothetical protein